MKKMGLFDLTSVGVGSIIGAGIFSMLSTGVGLTGRSIAVAVLLSMVLMCLQYVRSLFLSSMFTLDGGSYAQTALVIPPLLTGCTAFMNVINSLSYSIFGLSIASYLEQLFPVLAPYHKVVAVAVLAIFFFLASQGVNIFAKVQNVMAVCMYVALALFVIFGLPKVQFGGFEGEPFMFNGTGSFFTAVAIMSFACDGAFNIFNLQGEAKNAKRNVPLAFFLSSAVAALIYCLLGLVAGSVMPYAQASTTELGGVAQAIMPTPAYIFFVVCGAMFAICTTLLGGLVALPAPIVASAEDGWLPGVFKKKSNVYLIYFVVTLIPVIFDISFDILVSFVLVPGLVLGVVMNLRSFTIPKRFPNAWEKCGLKVPYGVYCFLIVVSILGSLVTAYFSVAGTPGWVIAGNAALTAGMFLYSYWRIKSGKVEIVSTAAATAAEQGND